MKLVIKNNTPQKDYDFVNNADIGSIFLAKDGDGEYWFFIKIFVKTHSVYVTLGCTEYNYKTGSAYSYDELVNELAGNNSSVIQLDDDKVELCIND